MSGEHGTRTSYKKRGCHCDECLAWAHEDQRKYRERHREERRARDRRRRKELGRPDPARVTAWANTWKRTVYMPSLEGAVRNGQPWTGPELEIAAKDDLTLAQAAAMTGRTVYAVATVRHQLRVEGRDGGGLP